MNLGAPLSLADVADLDFGKGAGLLPSIVQDADTGTVLMLGYMNAAALRATLERARVVFFSRSKDRLWEKGETSGNILELVTVRADCDRDSLLVSARARGRVCHLGTMSCFGDAPATPAAPFAFLSVLETVIERRITESPEGSYTANLIGQGVTRIAQKVGEEGLELALAGVADADDRVIAEAADLFFHVMVLLKSRNLSLAKVVAELAMRHTQRS
jgi:phosphoribosyl-AMP cyclohydrolase / phosphoribosyl-ATP pyrophosphohydrolase